MPAEQSAPRPSPRLRRSPPVVAIVGATGAVGKEFLRVLAERRFPMRELRLYGSRSAGSTLPFEGRELPVAVLDRNSFVGIDLALFSAGSGIARQFAPAAVRAGAVVIDNSSAFRQEREVPFVVPGDQPA